MMKKLNILYVFGFPLQIGGHFKSALAFARNLISLGHQIYIASPSGAEEKIQEFLAIGSKHFDIQGLKKVHRFPSIKGTSGILHVCKRHSIDIIHAQDFNAVAPSYLASIILKKKCVITQAGGPVARTVIPPPSKIRSVFYSQELMDGWTELYGLINANMTLIRARIDLSVYKPSELNRGFIEKHNLPDSGKKIIMAIRLNRAKLPWINNLLEIAQAISKKETEIKIVIAGEGSAFPELNKRAAKINQQSKKGTFIHFIGPIMQADEMNQLYNYADVIVGHGRGILEAMACKKPVIVLGEHGEGELINKNNIDDIAQFNFSGRHFRHVRKESIEWAPMLEDLLSSEEELSRARSFCHEYIKSQMDAAIGAKQLLEVYRDPFIEKNSFFDYLVWAAKAATYSLKTSIKNRWKKIMTVCSQIL